MSTLNNQNYVLISYVTKDEKYLNYSKKFIERLNELDMNNYEIEYFDLPQNTYYWSDKFSYNRIKKELVCLQKPKLIKKKLIKYNKPIICLDIDSYLLSKPEIPQVEFDIGFIFRPEVKLLYISNGLHVWKPTKNTYRFLDMWSYLCDWPDFTYLSDHHRLHQLIDIIKKEQNANHVRNDCQFIDVFDYFKDSYIEGLTEQRGNPVYRTLDGSKCQIKRGNYAK